jgi:hypothetical protein
MVRACGNDDGIPIFCHMFFFSFKNERCLAMPAAKELVDVLMHLVANLFPRFWGHCHEPSRSPGKQYLPEIVIL